MTRRELDAVLRRSADHPAPGADAAFVDALERRLLSQPDEADVLPFAPHPRRFGPAAVAVIAVGLGGAAAAAALVAADATRPDHPAQVITTSASADDTTVTPASSEPATTGPETTGPTTVTPSPTPASASTAAPPPPTAATTSAPTAPPASAPPSTFASTPTTTTPTPTTEVKTPATMTLSCSPTGSSVGCTWSAGPIGTASYAILRGQAGSSAPGRVFSVPVGTTSWSDPTAVPGTAYTYVVHALDAAAHSLAHSSLVPVNCC